MACPCFYRVSMMAKPTVLVYGMFGSTMNAVLSSSFVPGYRPMPIGHYSQTAAVHDIVTLDD